MSEHLAPQRWVDPQLPTLTAAHLREGREQPVEQAQESILKVLLDFFALVRRNWKLIIGTTLLAILAAFALIRLDQPIYRATATVRFEDKGRAMSAGLAGSGAPQLGGPVTDPLLTQIQVLQSRGVATEVVKREGLRMTTDATKLPDGWLIDVSVPDSVLLREVTVALGASQYTVSDGRNMARAQYNVPVTIGGIDLTVTRNPGVEQVTLKVIPVDRAIDNLLAHMRGRPRERTDIIDISFENSGRWTARRVANTAVQAFQEINARNAKQESVRRRQFIEQQLKKTSVLQSEAEAAHNVFRSREKVFSSQEKLRTQQTDLSGIELRRQELQADRNMYAALLQALQDPRRAVASERLNALVSSPGIAANAVVANLYQQLVRLQQSRDSMTIGPFGASANNPDVARLDGLIATTTTKVVGAVRGQIAAADARLTALGELKAGSASEMALLPTTEAQEAGLLAQVETYRKEAERLREELQKAQIEEAAEAGQIDIVDLAPLPNRPIGTGRTPRLVLALLVGFAVGSLIAYVLENYSAVVRRREDVERLTATPILAVIPPFAHAAASRFKLLGRGSKRALSQRVAQGSVGTHATELVTVSDQQSQAAEAFRTLRTNMLFSTAVTALRHILVTSAGPGEGKSSSAANLAVAFSQQGRRVLLVDCDLRRPRLHKMFAVPQIPGLTSVLVGSQNPIETAIETPIPNLWLMTAGPTPPNPVELLGSERMGDLIDRMSQQYDFVVFDTPPVLVASDASILSRHVDGTLFVVRAGKTQSEAMRDGLERLAHVGTRLIGLAINDPEGEMAKFSTYYGYYYQEYYGVTSQA